MRSWTKVKCRQLRRRCLTCRSHRGNPWVSDRIRYYGGVSIVIIVHIYVSLLIRRVNPLVKHPWSKVFFSFEQVCWNIYLQKAWFTDFVCPFLLFTFYENQQKYVIHQRCRWKTHEDTCGQRGAIRYLTCEMFFFPRVLMGKTTAEWYWQYRIRIMIHDNNKNVLYIYIIALITMIIIVRMIVITITLVIVNICIVFVYNIYIYMYTAHVWHVWHTVHIIWHWPSQCQAKNCNGNAGDGGKVMATRVSRYTLW